ncbi:MAG: ABC transporter permease [Spirochaetaceae bacterium]|nr:ABC transporter permease [Spirochaetaceae bacterium]
MFQTILIEGLIYALVALGVFITFRLLDFADLTVDGTFPLGGAVMAVCVLNNTPPALAFLLAFLAGCAGGVITAVIHNCLKVPGLLAGILTMTMLYSVNLRIMGGRSNVSYHGSGTFFNVLKLDGFAAVSGDLAVLLFLVLLVVCIKFACDLFFRTDFGLTLGALGGNPQLIISQGINPAYLKTAGVALSNGLVGLAGALASLYNGFADVSSGNGIVVAGLASVMLGEFLLSTNKIMLLTLRAILGSCLYRALMFAARAHGYKIGMKPNDFRLLTGLLIIVCLIASKYRGAFWQDLFGKKSKAAPSAHSKQGGPLAHT